jgi:hypothetical protein
MSADKRIAELNAHRDNVVKVWPDKKTILKARRREYVFMLFQKVVYGRPMVREKRCYVPWDDLDDALQEQQIRREIASQFFLSNKM